MLPHLSAICACGFYVSLLVAVYFTGSKRGCKRARQELKAAARDRQIERDLVAARKSGHEPLFLFTDRQLSA